MQRYLQKKPILNIIYDPFFGYPVPNSLTYLWNFGIIALCFLLIQIITGLILTMYYIPNINNAFVSVEYIMREINNGWMLRYFHANGASFFFISVYIHIARGIYFFSFLHPREILWLTGVIIFFMMIIIAFMGYVLPWGQMSYWGVTVITNLFSAFPLIGDNIVTWLWGNFTIGTSTIGHFFSFHILLSFLLVAIVILHLFFLHYIGSTNPLNIDIYIDSKPFYPYFIIKDIIGIIFFIIVYTLLIFFFPNFLNHSDNYITANSMSTPEHIVPEWYFLPFFAILRSIPNKLGGVLCLAISIFILIILPFSETSNKKGSSFQPIKKLFFWTFIFNFLSLGWIGGQAVKFPFLFLGKIFTYYYFLYLIFIVLLIGIVENCFWVFKKK